MHAPTPETIPVDLLLRAYRAGVFPMADHREDDDVFWVEPNERAIVPLDGLRLSKSLRKTIRQDRYRVTCDADFAGVIAACAEPREELAESWISRRIEASYRALHRAGHAHSIECWRDSETGGRDLVGGLYGVAFDRVFCGESMFARADNASKVALAWLVAAMRKADFLLLDCQFMTEHLASLGAVAMPQEEYVKRLAEARGHPRARLPQAVASFSVSCSEVSSSPGKLILHSLTQTS